MSILCQLCIWLVFPYECLSTQLIWLGILWTNLQEIFAFVYFIPYVQVSLFICFISICLDLINAQSITMGKVRGFRSARRVGHQFTFCLRYKERKAIARHQKKEVTKIQVDCFGSWSMHVLINGDMKLNTLCICCARFTRRLFKYK